MRPFPADKQAIGVLRTRLVMFIEKRSTMSCNFRRLSWASAFAVALVGLIAEPTRAQYQIHGRVVDQEADAPLSGVHVFLPRLHRGTVTDSTGGFLLAGLGSGIWTVEFSRVGYEKRVGTFATGTTEEPALVVALTPKTVLAGEALILADDPRHTADVPQYALSIDQSDRLESGRMSLWEHLDELPGIARSTNGPGIERPFIRGLSAGRILLMTQGLPYAYQTWDPEAGLATNGNGTEQIDVIQGPATLRYGPGAMGGVIHLAPEYPAPQGGVVGSYTGGLFSNTEGLYSELALKQTKDRWFWGARGSFDSHADYKAERDGEGANQALDKNEKEDEEEGRVPNSRYDHLHGQVFGGTSRDWGSSRLTYQFLRHRNGIVEAEEEEGREEEGEREIVPPYHSLMDHIMTSDTEIQAGKGWVHAIVGFQLNEQAEYEPAGETDREQKGEAAMELKLTTVHARVDYSTPLNNGWSLTTGVQGAVQESESEGEEPFVPSSEKKQLGIFGLARWERGAVLVEGGVRYDVQSLETSPAKLEAGAEPLPEGEGPTSEIEREFGLVSGSLGGTYRVGDGRYVKVNLGVGNRAPDVAELTANGLLREVRRYLVGDEELDPEYNVEGDVTLGWEFEAASISVGGFVNRIGNYTYLFTFGETEVWFPVYLYRQADATFKGGHAEVVIHPNAAKGFRIFSRVDVVLARLDQGGGIDAPMIPAPQLSNGIEVRRSDVGAFSSLTFRAELDMFLKQDRVAPWESPSEGYSLVNASVNAYIPWGGRAVTVGLHGLNLLNKAYVSHLSLLKEDGIPDIGRSVNLTVSVPFGG